MSWAAAVEGLLGIPGKAQAQTAAHGGVCFAVFAVLQQGLEVAFAQLPEMVAGLFGHFFAIDQLRLEVAHDAAVDRFCQLVQGTHFGLQLGKPDGPQHAAVQPDLRLHKIVARAYCSPALLLTRKPPDHTAKLGLAMLCAASPRRFASTGSPGFLLCKQAQQGREFAPRAFFRVGPQGAGFFAGVVHGGGGARHAAVVVCMGQKPFGVMQAIALKQAKPGIAAPAAP